MNISQIIQDASQFYQSHDGRFVGHAPGDEDSTLNDLLGRIAGRTGQDGPQTAPHPPARSRTDSSVDPPARRGLSFATRDLSWVIPALIAAISGSNGRQLAAGIAGGALQTRMAQNDAANKRAYEIWRSHQEPRPRASKPRVDPGWPIPPDRYPGGIPPIIGEGRYPGGTPPIALDYNPPHGEPNDPRDSQPDTPAVMTPPPGSEQPPVKTG